MTTTAYDVPRAYAWPASCAPRRRIVRLARLALTLLALVPPIGFVAMLAGGLNANVMTTGSMEPRIDVGSLLLYESVPPEALRVGDVISFQRPGGDRAVTTHRIVDVADQDGTRIFRTKGDNNPIVDPWVIHYEEGQEPKRLLTAVPYVGHAVRIAQTPVVRIAILVLVLGWLYLSFLRALVRAGGRRENEALGIPPRPAVTRENRSRAESPAIAVAAATPATPPTPGPVGTRRPVRPGSRPRISARPRTYAVAPQRRQLVEPVRS